MERFKKLSVSDFEGHLIPDASGKRIQLYQFEVDSYEPQEFQLIFSIKTTLYSSSMDKEMAVRPIATLYQKGIGDLSHCKIIEVPDNKNLYLQIEKCTGVTGTPLPMRISYQVLG
jgi:hypothetical protein